MPTFQIRQCERLIRTYRVEAATLAEALTAVLDEEAEESMLDAGFAGYDEARGVLLEHVPAAVVEHLRTSGHLSADDKVLPSIVEFGEVDPDEA